MSVAVRPFLMFEGKAEEAMQTYVSLVPGSKIIELQKVRARQPRQGRNGDARRVLAGGIGGAVHRQLRAACLHLHAVLLLVLDCEAEAQLEIAREDPSEGGAAMMPLENYGFSRRFGWLSDCFGVSWQLNLP